MIHMYAILKICILELKKQVCRMLRDRKSYIKPIVTTEKLEWLYSYQAKQILRKTLK